MRETRFSPFNSLTSRLIFVLGGWTAFALLVAGLLISNFLQSKAETDFQQLLLAHAYNLMGAVDVDDNGDLVGKPDLGDPRFLEPGSGWYWFVSAARKPTLPLLHSSSITGEPKPVLSTGELPFNDRFTRSYKLSSGPDENVQRLEAQLYFGEAPTLYQVTIAGNRSDFDAAVTSVNRAILFILLIYGLGTVIAGYFIVRLGLKPLDAATETLRAVGRGDTQRLQGSFPHEIKPFVDATNQLIDANENVVKRARAQVGNLAHALKTPLAVIRNETEKYEPQSADRVRRQAERMREQVQSHLDRARIAAQRENIGARTKVSAVVERLLGALRKLHPDTRFRQSGSADSLWFRGEQQDLEEVLGNLLDNAARHASAEVELGLEPIGENLLQMTVSDDGEGISAQDREAALKRGERLDTDRPGSGLGLAIVKDIVEDYGGSIELHDSDLGGLKTVVLLPRMSRRTAATMKE